MKINLLLPAFMAFASVLSAQTLDECQQAAENNYPLIKQYGLIAQTKELNVRNIQKGWFPQIKVSGQATYQSAVASWPSHLQTMFSQAGVATKGLSKDQYKIGVELQQAIYDGGVIGSQAEIARQQSKVREVQNEVNLYQVRQRVNEMYFGLLLLDEQIKLTDDVKKLLLSSEEKLSALLKGGTASQSDFENVKAERLSAEQQNESLKTQRQTMQRMLSLFCGIEVTKVSKPELLKASSSANLRPELRLFDQQLQLTQVEEKALNAQLRPQLGLFAQDYYGYPGLNLFEDMQSRQWSLNGVVGVKLSWNLTPLYTHRNRKSQFKVQRDLIENAREVFLFNNRLDETQQLENIRRYQQMMQADREIIALRTGIRRAAESKLSHGLIDVNSLLREINNENASKIQQAIHEIDLLKAMYQLKYSHND